MEDTICVSFSVYPKFLKEQLGLKDILKFKKTILENAFMFPEPDIKCIIFLFLVQQSNSL